MEDDARATENKYHDAVFADLMSECKNNAPGARFSASLRQKLEAMSPGERRALVGRMRDGCAPLLVAARRGNAEAVEFLVHVCAAELEQRGVYEAPEDRSRHSVTPLWCAAVAGRVDALRLLIEAGACVDAASDTGSTPARSACFMSHTEAVALLVASGADVRRANHNGGTCLINAVQSARLCALLLDAGAAADARDAQGRTALHYAAQEHRLDTARLLLARGAHPRLRDRAGDDPLRVACIRGATHIVKLLLARGQYTISETADAYELLGATHLDEFNDFGAAINAWRHATMLRQSAGEYEEKRWAVEEGVSAAAAARLRTGAARAAGGGEWRGERELAAAERDAARLRGFALVVAARVLGATHKETLYRYMYRGAAYADEFQYQRCIDLWMWALRVRLGKHTILCTEAAQTAEALTRLLLDADAGRLERAAPPRFADVARTLDLLVRASLLAQRLLKVRPVSRVQQANGEAGARCVAHLALVALRGARAARERRRVWRCVRRALAGGVRGARGSTLLHLAVSRRTRLHSAYFADGPPLPPPSPRAAFPSARLVRLLLRCGADAAALDDVCCTPLHVAMLPDNYSDEIVEMLLEAGAHLDQPNAYGESALQTLCALRAAGVASRVCSARHVSLACLCARALAARPPPPAALLPRALHRLLDQHRTPRPLHPPHPPPTPDPEPSPSPEPDAHDA